MHNIPQPWCCTVFLVKKCIITNQPHFAMKFFKQVLGLACLMFVLNMTAAMAFPTNFGFTSATQNWWTATNNDEARTQLNAANVFDHGGGSLASLVIRSAAWPKLRAHGRSHSSCIPFSEWHRDLTGLHISLVLGTETMRQVCLKAWCFFIIWLSFARWYLSRPRGVSLRGLLFVWRKDWLFSLNTYLTWDA